MAAAPRPPSSSPGRAYSRVYSVPLFLSSSLLLSLPNSLVSVYTCMYIYIYVRVYISLSLSRARALSLSYTHTHTLGHWRARALSRTTSARRKKHLLDRFSLSRALALSLSLSPLSFSPSIYLSLLRSPLHTKELIIISRARTHARSAVCHLLRHLATTVSLYDNVVVIAVVLRAAEPVAGSTAAAAHTVVDDVSGPRARARVSSRAPRVYMAHTGGERRAEYTHTHSTLQHRPHT